MAKLGRPVTAKSLKDYFASGNGRKIWSDGKANFQKGGGSFLEFDDGKYNAKIIKAESNVSKNGRVQDVIHFKFIDGEYKGKTKIWYQGLENEIGVAVLLQAFSKLGHEIDNPDEIETVNKKLSKEQPQVELRLVTKNEFQNLTVLKKIDGEIESEEEDEEEKEIEKKDVKEEENEDEDIEEPKEKKKKDEDEDEDDSDEDEDDEDDEDEEEKEEEDDDKEEEEDEVSLEVGMKIKFEYKGDEVKGKIVKILEDEKQVKVKLANGDKVLIGLDAIVDVI